MTDTQPFMDEARAVLTGRRLAFDNETGAQALVGDIATALSSTYQRGREEERAEQDRRTEEYPKRWAERHSAIRTERDKG